MSALNEITIENGNELEQVLELEIDYVELQQDNLYEAAVIETITENGNEPEYTTENGNEPEHITENRNEPGQSNTLDKITVLVDSDYDYEPQQDDFEEADDNDYAPDTSNRKRRKRRCVQPTEWKRNKNIDQRQLGKSYNGSKKDKESGKWKYNIEKRERNLLPRCNCKNDSCKMLTDENRSQIYSEFWALSTWQEKKMYVCSLMQCNNTTRARDRRVEGESRRSNSFIYNLKVGESVFKVCKIMFLNTLCLGEYAVRSWKIQQIGHISPPLKRLKRGEKVKNLAERRLQLKNFLHSLAKMPSHYGRADSKKLYLEPIWVTKTELYRTYCAEVKDPLSMPVFDETFDELNLALYVEKKIDAKCATLTNRGIFPIL